MSKEKGASTLSDVNGKNLPAPPGFVSLTAFSLKRISDIDENGNFKYCSDAAKGEVQQIDAVSGMSKSDILEKHLRKRPRLLSEPTNEESEESDSEQSDDQDFPSETCLPKGVIHGCTESSNCLKVTARWRPEDARKDVVEEAPVFHPTEEEFKDTLKYIAKIRPRAESCGICRIIPPPSWSTTCVLKEEKIWANSKFITLVQRIDGIQFPYSQCKTSFGEDTNAKRRRTTGIGLGFACGNGHMESHGEDIEHVDSVCGPEFTLESFEKYADDFKGQYFSKNEILSSNDCSTTNNEELRPSIENVEGEYKRIVDAPTEEIEVLCCDGSTSGVLSSGFPTVSESSHPEIINSGWNLNNVPTLFGSLLSLENHETSRILAPQVRIGMCFSTLHWSVEEHQLYSLCYSHMGAPKIWYSVPERDSLKFQLALKNCSADLSEKQHRLVKPLSPSALKSEGIPVFRCIQNPGEFVLVFPGAYRSGFDCGFNCSETANFAPLDWLPHGKHAVEIYRDLGRKTSLSHDKLLLRAASEAVRAQWELSLRGNKTSVNQFWKDACGKEGILTKEFKSRVKSEEMARKFLCSSSRVRKMDESFDATIKRECEICLYDLHFSAAGCPCSEDRFSCLDHSKQLCSSCPWTDKFFLFRHDISDLNVLVEALEGKLSSTVKWAKVKLGLSLNSTSSTQASTPENRTIIRAQMKAQILQSLHKLKTKDLITRIDGAKILASCVNKGTEACISEPTKPSNPIEPKQKTTAVASGSSKDRDCSFPEMAVALGVSPRSLGDTSSDDESEGDESDGDPPYVFQL